MFTVHRQPPRIHPHRARVIDRDIHSQARLLTVGLLGDGLSEHAARRASELILRVTTSMVIAPPELLPLRDVEQARRFSIAYLVPIPDASARFSAD